MNTETQSVARQGVTVLSCIGSDVWKEEVQKVLPKEIALEAMLRVGRSVASDPKFLSTDPKSFLLALLKCGRAGLYPDGREAHLIAFGKDVQVIFDVKGICALAGRAGILVTPKLVFEKDFFEVEEDDGNGKTKITHRVDYRKPRGEIQAVYSRAVMPSGAVDYEIMSADEVEKVRQNFSKAKNSTPWVNSWGEMAKKTAVKRHSKRWDMSPDVRQALNADDDSLPSTDLKPSVAPIFKASDISEPDQPIQDATIVPEEPQPVPATVTPVPVPKPVAVKPAPVAAPIKPGPLDSRSRPAAPVSKTETVKPKTPLDTLREALQANGITVAQMVRFLIETGQVEESTTTLDQVVINAPEVMEMVMGSLEDIFDKIKNS